MSAGKPQLKVSLGTVEVTDTERRAIAWHAGGRQDPMIHKGHVQWYSGTHADRAVCREFLLKHGQKGLDNTVTLFFAAGGQTAGMEREGMRA
jgi:hypothetical protein